MYCMKCGNKLNDDSKFCDKCGHSIENTNQNNENNLSKLTCPHCGSTNVQVQIVSENKSTGCLTIFLYVFLALTIVGIPIMILVLLLKGKNTINRKYYVCQNCGKSFNPNFDKDYIKNEFTNFSIIRVLITVFVILGLLILMLRYSTG